MWRLAVANCRVALTLWIMLFANPKNCASAKVSKQSSFYSTMPNIVIEMTCMSVRLSIRHDRKIGVAYAAALRKHNCIK